VIATASAAAVLAFALVAAPATADVFRHDEHRFKLTIDDDFERDGEALLWRNGRAEQTLSITRINSSNHAAWRGKRSFFAGVETGVRSNAPGYRALKKRRGRLGRVPHLDLIFEYDADGDTKITVAMRFVFFRRYTLVLAVDTPARRYRKHRRAVRKLTKSFKPYFPPK